MGRKSYLNFQVFAARVNTEVVIQVFVFTHLFNSYVQGTSK